MELSFTLALVMGLFSTIHCLGMCGSISSALSVSLARDIKSSPPRLAGYLSFYNLGRVGSYTLAGGLVGYVGAGITDAEIFSIGRDVARILSSVIIIVVGLYITKWIPLLRQMDRLGAPVWRLLEPRTRRLLPANNPASAFVYGCIWGWLPCGLVYYVLLLSASSGGVLEGALCMLGFGLGTLPSMIGMGYFMGRIAHIARHQGLRIITGLCFVALGIFTLIGNAVSI